MANMIGAITPGRQRGFSLIELIAVIIVLGVISFIAVPRFASSDAAAVQSARDQALGALFTAQQLAMARASSGNIIQVSIDANRIDVTENGTSVNHVGANFPIVLPNGVSITAGTGNYAYDKLGRTSAGQIVLARGSTSATILLEASGYAYSQ